ncbi:hypothetical protein [uncultured Shewanella sp.]|nr:hypothetical protein [uncultured Shewanella sp.]
MAIKEDLGMVRVFSLAITPLFPLVLLLLHYLASGSCTACLFDGVDILY